jgi:hypothetical protein
VTIGGVSRVSPEGWRRIGGATGLGSAAGVAAFGVGDAYFQSVLGANTFEVAWGGVLALLTVPILGLLAVTLLAVRWGASKGWACLCLVDIPDKSGRARGECP